MLRSLVLVILVACGNRSSGSVDAPPGMKTACGNAGLMCDYATEIRRADADRAEQATRVDRSQAVARTIERATARARRCARDRSPRASRAPRRTRSRVNVLSVSDITGRGRPTRRRRHRLLFPDRHAILQAIDHRAACGERFGAMRSGGGDHDGDVADAEPADAVLDGDARAREPASISSHSSVITLIAIGAYASYSR